MVYVYGGSFNPPTIAHEKIIETLLAQDLKSKVIVMPVGNDYNKKGLIDANHRLNMLNIMLSNVARVTVSKLEIEGAYQGTLATLDKLSETYDDLAYVIGSDQLSKIRSWINYEKLLEKYQFVIMMRYNMHPDDAEFMVNGLRHDFYYIPFDQPVASSMIRTRKAGYEKFLDPRVLAYIEENHLYEG